MSIFISYRRKLSVDFATTLKYTFNEFSANQAQLFLDQTNLTSGEPYPVELENQLEQSQIFVPIIQGAYLREFEERKKNNVDDWVLKEIKFVYEKKAVDTKSIKVLPIHINNQDFNIENIQKSPILDEESKKILEWLGSLHTEFIFPHSPGNFYLQRLVLKLFSELELINYNSNNEELIKFIRQIKESNNLKILVIGPSALYDLACIQNISMDVMKKLQDKMDPEGTISNVWARKAIGNNLLKCCEYFISKYGEVNKYNELLRILNKPKNINQNRLELIKKALNHFDIVVDFSLLYYTLLETLDQENFYILNKVLTEKGYKEELLGHISRASQKEIKLYLPIQHILETEDYKETPQYQYSLLTTHEYLKFIKSDHKNLESLNAKMLTHDNLTVFCGIGEVDMILKSLFIEDTPIFTSRPKPGRANPFKVKPRALLYGLDFDLMHKGYYESKSFIVEQMPLEEFLEHLINQSDE